MNGGCCGGKLVMTGTQKKMWMVGHGCVGVEGQTQTEGWHFPRNPHWLSIREIIALRRAGTRGGALLI